MNRDKKVKLNIIQIGFLLLLFYIVIFGWYHMAKQVQEMNDQIKTEQQYREATK